jgi:hypothetical protein
MKGKSQLLFHTNLVLSCRHLTKVVCSWGRKGFREMPPFLIMIVRVDKIALFTCHGKRSPIMRMRGLWHTWLAKSECIKKSNIPDIVNNNLHLIWPWIMECQLRLVPWGDITHNNKNGWARSNSSSTSQSCSYHIKTRTVTA